MKLYAKNDIYYLITKGKLKKDKKSFDNVVEKTLLKMLHEHNNKNILSLKPPKIVDRR